MMCGGLFQGGLPGPVLCVLFAFYACFLLRHALQHLLKVITEAVKLVMLSQIMPIFGLTY